VNETAVFKQTSVPKLSGKMLFIRTSQSTTLSENVSLYLKLW